MAISMHTSNFRRRLTYAFIHHSRTVISDINTDDGGLKDFEISLLRLFDKISNGTEIEINEAATEVTIKPGTLVGGKLQHEFPLSRGLSYFIEPLLVLAPFFKAPLRLSCYGITNHLWDASIDVLRSTVIPVMSKFGYEGAEIKIARRGYEPEGGGAVDLILPLCESIVPTVLCDVGKVRKIRGLAVCAKVPPQTTNKIMEASRSLLTTFIPDVYVYTDAVKGKLSGKSPGYSLALVAESTDGNLWSYEMTGRPGEDPKELGRSCAVALLAQIARGGGIDHACQWLVATWSAVACQDLCKFSVGGDQLDDQLVLILRDILSVFGVRFRIKQDAANKVFELSVIGMGDLSWNKTRA